MEYGKLVELVMEKFGYERMEANAYLGAAFYSLATDKTVDRLVKFIQEKA